MARIVSEMNQPVPDPTALTTLQTTPESSTESDSESDDADMLCELLIVIVFSDKTTNKLFHQITYLK